MTNVKMVVTRPNPDDWGKFEDSVLKQMEKQHAREVVYEYRAIRGQSIELDQHWQKVARVAADNGKVEVKGRNAYGQPVFQSTDNFPKTLTEKYDPDELTAKQMFNLMADKFIDTE